MGYAIGKPDTGIDPDYSQQEQDSQYWKYCDLELLRLYGSECGEQRTTDSRQHSNGITNQQR